MDFKEDRNKKILSIIIIIAVIGLGIYEIFFHKKDSKESVDTTTISVVKDADDFFTVSSCVSRFLTYLYENDSSKLLILISDEYKKNNSITESNVNEYFNKLNGMYNFNPRKMYVQRMGTSVYKFYVYGLLQKESINASSNNSSDYYLIVILDRKNMTFSVEPYDGAIFKED